MNKVVEATLTFECGRCSNLVKRVVRSTDDGLIELPSVYCGRCVGHKHFSQVSMTISQERVVELPAPKPEKDPRDMTLREMANAWTNQSSKSPGLQRCDAVPEAGKGPDAVGEQAEGREFADEAGDTDPVSED